MDIDSAPDVGDNTQAQATNKCGERQCEAEGCRAMLQGFGRYCMQRKLCPVHLKATAVRRKNYGDQLWRFCQQCGKLEHLSAFEGMKRSCMTQLARRRAGSASRSSDTNHEVHRQSIKQAPGTRRSSDGATTSRAAAAAAPAAEPPAAGAAGTSVLNAAGNMEAGRLAAALPQQLVHESVLSVPPAAAPCSGGEEPTPPVQQCLRPDLAAVWQQLGPVTVSPLSSAAELEQQRLLLERKVAVIDTQMVLLQEQQQLESQLLTLHQQYMQRQQELQSRLQHTQQQMQLLSNLQPDLPMPPCLSDGWGSSNALGHHLHMPLPSLGSFTASAAGTQGAAPTNCSTVPTVLDQSTGQGRVPGVCMRATAELLLAQAEAQPDTSHHHPALRALQASVNESFTSRSTEAVHMAGVPAAAAAEGSIGDGVPQVGAAAAAGAAGGLPDPVIAAVSAAENAQSDEAGVCPAGSKPHGGSVPGQPSDKQPHAAAAPAEAPGGGSGSGTPVVSLTDAGAAAGVSPFSAAAGVATAAKDVAAQESAAVGDKGEPSLGAQLGPWFVDKNNSLEAFASVLQMALTETEAVFSVLDKSMSFPFKLE